ncbi:MarR family winged helix-turn-helix transcriptional regulator [Knoellia subterranea]|uniref:MarR family transcripitonal regulator n=1 Tax=Knoellia subterranea KCTC 19937 TaxID=1385521 RepID=A0A0A0JKC5_9MICO|nr:MarR family transcriptional regulator [Knoellia subterranea]KGN37518.1 MarR family transcripitonal regulator [Knoellia subterranea KCTC 19937]
MGNEKQVDAGREQVDTDAFLRSVARLHRLATRNAANLDVPPAQMRLLALVSDLGPARIGDLAEADHSSQPTMTTQVQRAEAHGWLTRTPDPDDARASLIALSPKGGRQLAAARAARTAAIAPLFAELGPRDAATLNRAVAIVDRLLTNPSPD